MGKRIKELLGNKWTYFTLVMLILVVFGLGRLYYKLTDNFTINNITSDFAYRENIHIAPPTPSELEKVNEILAQPFTYLGKGAQAYAFLSADGQYVLKIVKQKHYKFSTIESWILSIPFFDQIRERKLEKRKRKMTNFLASCVLCYEELREETALLYIHLTRTDRLHPSVRIYDKIGLPHTLDPDQIEFIIQRKAELLTSKITDFMEKQDILDAEKSLGEVEHLFISCWKKGIVDRDTNFINNVGFVGDKAIFIDVGEFYRDDHYKDPVFYKKNMAKSLSQLTEWIYNTYPQLVLPEVEE